MQNKNIPGTTIPYSDESAQAFSYIKPLITAARGLGLSQVCAITGLESSTIQNWVKRGWVGSVRDKKYTEAQVARVIIISALRGCLMLDDIARLMTYVNGVAMDTSDDIVEEGELFNYLCEAARAAELRESVSRAAIEASVDKVIADYQGVGDARARLRASLVVMVYACLCSEMAETTNDMLRELI